MVTIHSIGTANPPYIYEQEQIKELTKEIFHNLPQLDRYLSVYKNTAIEKRHFCKPLDWFRHPHSFHEKNQFYLEHALELGEEAIRKCLGSVGCLPEEIDHMILVSSTGISTPSLDAYLINRLHMQKHIKRTPLWGLGCAGGAVGISRAYDYAKAYPAHKILLVAIEICSLTFLKDDLSKSNIIATSLFADGAAAVLISGNSLNSSAIAKPSLNIIGNMSTIYPDTLDIMGWDLQADGLKVIFSRDIPSFVQQVFKPNLDQFLMNHQLDLETLSHFVLHPGGAKVLDAYESSLQISPEKTYISREVIRQFGNMSSATVLFVLEQFISNGKAGEYGILSALGPGFSSELVLLKWE